MSYEKVKLAMLEWETIVPERMKTRIHYRTMRNFMLHFYEIRSERDRDKILAILEEYVQCVQQNDYNFEHGESTDLATGYLFPLVDYYREDLGFMRVVKLQEVAIGGFLVDSILYLTGVLSHVWYIPAATTLLFGYYLFLRISKVGSGKVYGMFY